MSFLSFIIYRFSTAFLAGAMNMNGISFSTETQRSGCKIRHLVIWAVSPTGQRPTGFVGTNQMDGKLQQPIRWEQSWYKGLCNHFPALFAEFTYWVGRASWGSVYDLWRRKERLFDPRLYAVNKQAILFLRMTKRWSKFYPKVKVRVAKEAHKEKMIAFHRTKGGKQMCLQLNPRTLLVSFIWSVFASNLPTISQKWNPS